MNTPTVSDDNPKVCRNSKASTKGDDHSGSRVERQATAVDEQNLNHRSVRINVGLSHGDGIGDARRQNDIRSKTATPTAIWSDDRTIRETKATARSHRIS